MNYYKGIDDLLAHHEKQSFETSVSEFYKLIDKSEPYKPNTFYLSNHLRIVHNADTSGKHKIALYHDKNLIHTDCFKIVEADKRDKFTKPLNLSNDDKAAINLVLMQLSQTQPITSRQQTYSEEKSILTQILSDGRILEALSTGQLALYDPQNDSVEYVDSFIDDDILYKPVSDNFTKKLLCEKVGDYKDESELVGLICGYIQRHYDIAEFYRKICAYYILLTAVIDKYNVISYLHPRGDSGDGKTRLLDTLISVSYRGYKVASANVAPLFRFITRYSPCLAIDEFNPVGDDKKDVIDLLLTGYKRGTSIPRCRQNDPDILDEFNGFGAKMISSYQKFSDTALNNRSIDILCKETSRLDIQFTDTGQIEADARPLKEKILRFRLRNLHRDYNSRTKEAENFLKSHIDEKGKLKIRPRFIETLSPLLALVQDDEELKKELADMLMGETRTVKRLNQEGFNYEVISAIHAILFETYDEKEGLTATWRKHYQFEFDKFGEEVTGINSNDKYEVLKDGKEPEHGQILSPLTVNNILDRVNLKREKGNKIKIQGFGKTLIQRFGFDTATDWTRGSLSYGKSVLIYNADVLAKQFASFSLPVPKNSYLGNLGNTLNPNQDSDLQVPRYEEINNEKDSYLGNGNYNKTHTLNDSAKIAKIYPVQNSAKIENNGRIIVEL